ncbi:hypothetical protein SAMN02982917_0555 [Azospirillum oryzae]|uniref:Uncharacterized protein n=1 Tax=Azospirillum oryzae TaxID=286727 RepID=A0A1X7HTQ8_9PROT|nr:hypothetical protein [Azospirillum oryzae]SMF92308.1 hypothetical protein SAMN02982917_0555 [Azospirillum oryzae]
MNNKPANLEEANLLDIALGTADTQMTNEHEKDVGKDIFASYRIYQEPKTIMQNYVNIIVSYFHSNDVDDPPSVDDVPEGLRDLARANWHIAEASILTARSVFRSGHEYFTPDVCHALSKVTDDQFYDAEEEVWSEIRYRFQEALWRHSAGYCGEHRAAIYNSFAEAVRVAHVASASLLPNRYRSFQRLAPLLIDVAKGHEWSTAVFVEGALRYLKETDRHNIVNNPRKKANKEHYNDEEGERSRGTERVGPAWFHQLTVFLLHLCQIKVIELTPAIVALASYASTVPNSGAKSAKAARFLEALQEDKRPVFAHEAPITVIVAKRLAWELLAYADANRQISYMRKIERAVAFCRGRLASSGEMPNPNELSQASGLSWTDAEDLLNSHVLLYEVDEYHVRWLRAVEHAEDCPDCRALAESPEMERYKKGGKRLPSSTD